MRKSLIKIRLENNLLLIKILFAKEFFKIKAIPCFISFCEDYWMLSSVLWLHYRLLLGEFSCLLRTLFGFFLVNLKVNIMEHWFDWNRNFVYFFGAVFFGSWWVLSKWNRVEYQHKTGSMPKMVWCNLENPWNSYTIHHYDSSSFWYVCQLVCV